jgi:hypothetical protein
MPFLICPLNRYSLDKHLFRSPWTSNYYPEANKGNDFKELFNEAHLELSNFESRANEMFNFYAELYYNGQKGLVTSVYIIDYEPNEFIEMIFLLKKTEEGSEGNIFCTVHHFKILLQSDKTKFICFSGVYSNVKSDGFEMSFKNDIRDEFTTKDNIKTGIHKYYISCMGEMIEENERYFIIVVIFRRFFNDFKELWLSKAFMSSQSEFRIRDRDNMKLAGGGSQANQSDSRVTRQKFMNLNEEFTKVGFEDYIYS